MFQKENDLVKVFLRGTKEAKKELMKTHPDLYAKFERMWGVRDMHLVKSYPLKYISSFDVVTKINVFTPDAQKVGHLK